MFGRKPIEERLAERRAQLPPLKEGEHFEHAPAKFIFIFLIVFVVLGHLVGLFVLMALNLH
ncbi:hypothetical protein [Sphaerisporangium fuscum]|uniref:hypothetical protein n=1 Tax=Sphaerisporangium fuscum TaxID=2835868 RepID=UPI001BDD3EEB|nr:hypothetical protein [Sphaerisporangium fuscum]